jgi:hypothetical protein
MYVFLHSNAAMIDKDDLFLFQPELLPRFPPQVVLGPELVGANAERDHCGARRRNGDQPVIDRLVGLA